MTATLAIGVDAVNLLRDRRGIGRYVRALLRIWHRDFAGRIEPTLLVPHAFPSLPVPRFRELLGGMPVRVERRTRAARLGLKLVWYPWNGMTWISTLPSVVTIHDVWPFVSPARLANQRKREQSHYLTAVAHATRFIAVSTFTKSEAVRYLRLEPDRIDVVMQGVEPLTATPPAPARIDGAERYVLFVGEAEPRKDLPTLLEAMSKLPDDLRRTTTLVVVGANSPAIGNDGVGVSVKTTGEVSDERLASLYAGASVLAFPSRYEGFGVPVLEAMQYGAPVVASDAASIPESGADAALYFRGGDAADLADKLTSVLRDASLAKRLSSLGFARAAEMAQTLCARRTLEVMERVAASI